MAQAEDLVSTFVKGYGEAIKTVEALTDEQWRLTTEDEGWPVCVVAHHLAAQSGVQTLEWILSGQSTPFWADENELNAENAQHARDFSDCTKEETLDFLRDVFSRFEEVVGALTDEQLQMRGATFGGEPTTVEQFILITMRLHIESHHGSILQAISQSPTG